MGMGRVMSMMSYFEFEPTVERVDGLFELFDCVGTFLGALQKEKYRVGGGYVYDDLADDWADDGWCLDDLGALALGGLICSRLGFLERIFPEVPGIDPEQTGIYAVTEDGAAWYERYQATYAARRAKWREEQGYEAAGPALADSEQEETERGE